MGGSLRELVYTLNIDGLAIPYRLNGADNFTLAVTVLGKEICRLKELPAGEFYILGDETRVFADYRRAAEFSVLTHVCSLLVSKYETTH